MLKTISASRVFLLAVASTLLFSSCEKDDDDMMTQDQTQNDDLQMASYEYNFNNGQVIPTAYYTGEHSDELTATMDLEEMSDGTTKITVSLTNTVDGAMYMIHAHDAADPATTPNGTPYNETPNSDVFTKMATGNGGTVSVSQTTDMAFTELTNDYAAFFVVHDPLQNISTTDLSTYIVLGTFAREQSYNLNVQEFNYDFNTGQVAQEFAYDGTHPTNLSANLRVQELGSGESRVTVSVNNSINSEMYMVHSHDSADPSTTPNGTPYNETPNSDVCTLMIMGNGGMSMSNQISSLSLNELSTNYSGFFVIHDPLQPISTTDPTTYVVLGSFAR